MLVGGLELEKERRAESRDGHDGANPSRLPTLGPPKFPVLITTMYGDVGNKLVDSICSLLTSID